MSPWPRNSGTCLVHLSLSYPFIPIPPQTQAKTTTPVDFHLINYQKYALSYLQYQPTLKAMTDPVEKTPRKNTSKSDLKFCTQKYMNSPKPTKYHRASNKPNHLYQQTSFSGFVTRTSSRMTTIIRVPDTIEQTIS